VELLVYQKLQLSPITEFGLLLLCFPFYSMLAQKIVFIVHYHFIIRIFFFFFSLLFFFCFSIFLLFRSAGIIGLGFLFQRQASLVLRKKFSASKFTEDG